jgi:hypothetical protein
VPPSIRLLLVLPALAWGCAASRPLDAGGPAPAPRSVAEAPGQGSQLEADVDSYLAQAGGQPFAPRFTGLPLAADETLPPVKVEAKRFHDDEPVGPYNQPAWTTHRRFTTTRAYVLPPGRIELEGWWRGTWPDGTQPKERVQGELGVGLPYRFQLDFYENFEDPSGGAIDWDGSSFEVRWALADWGKLFWNPTLYGEWKFVAQGPDVYEFKLLFSDDIAPKWRGAVNAIYEAQDSGAEETEIAISMAASYTVRDDTFYVGAETKINRVSEGGPDGAPDMEILLGPSFQWRPTATTHLDVVPLFGLTKDSPVAQVFIVFGIGFGGGEEHGFALAHSIPCALSMPQPNS